VQTPAHINAFLWSSPAVANRRVYIGIATQCDNEPTVPGAGVVALDQATGVPVATYFTEPPGIPGAGVWSSVAVDPSDGSVFVSTGNPQLDPDPGDGNSILHLDGRTLSKLDKWTVPPGQQTADGDFGASPVLFSAGTQPRVGACNKNGIFYALARSALAAGPVWQRKVGTAAADAPTCLAGAAFDGTHLYIGANTTTISGASSPGSLRALDPASGNPAWEIGLPNAVLGTPTVNGSEVVAASTDSYSATNATLLFDAHTGAIVQSFNTNGVFAQAVWADNRLIVATQQQGLQGYGLP
jgi:outer membrane protein assembly factor BamB